MNDTTNTTPPPVDEKLVESGFTSGGVDVSEKPTTPPVVDSTESVLPSGEMGNDSTTTATVAATGSVESPGESTSADVSAETSVAPTPVSSESLSSDLSKPAPTSPEPSPALALPAHESYFARLKDVAKGVEMEIVDDVKELEQKLRNFSSEMSYAVDRYKKEFNIK